jgi:xylulokinase
VAGVDSSTQSCKVLVCDSATGAVVRQATTAHPDGTEVDPTHWWDALRTACGDGLLDGVEAIAVGGQQHGMVLQDDSGDVVRPALLWNDTRSADAALDLVAELGGPQAWATAVGSVPLAAFTVTKLRWVAEHEPENAAQASSVQLPHDWLTQQLRGGSAPAAAAEAMTDRGDASGTGYWSPGEGDYRPDLLERAFGRILSTPRVLGAAEPAGQTRGGGSGIPDGLLVGPGTGDNMGAALGLGLEQGDVVVSLGTSGTVFAVHDSQSADPRGEVAGFADATGRFLPLVCTLNAARVLTASASMLGVDLDAFARLALEASPGAAGMVLLPYLDGERTPNLPTATGSLTGLTRSAMTPQNLARAAVEGMLCLLADGVDALRAQGVPVHRVLLIGGASRSEAVQRLAPDVFGTPVVVPAAAEYVALGAARQAAWVLARSTGADDELPPSWPLPSTPPREPSGSGAEVRAAYAAARLQMHGI